LEKPPAVSRLNPTLKKIVSFTAENQALPAKSITGQRLLFERQGGARFLNYRCRRRCLGR
jgi:hypothetical protein